MKPFFFLLLVVSLSVSNVLATEMQSPGYILESGSIETPTEELPTDEGLEESSRLNTFLTPEEQTTFVEQGFVYLNTELYADTQFTSTVSNGTVEFSNLTTEQIQDKDINLTVNSNIPVKSLIYAVQETPFISPNGDPIPNTLCQQTQQLCTSTTAQDWHRSTTYGLGYKLSGNNKPIDFLTSNHYRTFNKSQLINKLLTHNNPNSSSVLEFGISVSPEQSESSYETIVSVLVIPQP